MKSICRVWVLLLSLVCTGLSAEGIEVGDLVVSKRDNQILTSNRQTIAVRAGQHLVVEKTDKDQLFVYTGKVRGWVPSKQVDLSDRKPKSVSFTINYKIIPGKATSKVELISTIPRTIPGRQTIRQLEYSVQPVKRFTKSATKYSRFLFTKPSKPVSVQIEVKADIYQYDLNTALRIGKPESSDIQRWLVSERYLEKDAPEVRAAAATILGKDTMTTVRAIMAYVTNTLEKSSYQDKQRGAIGALKHKHGDCTEFADLFVALCRAKGIAARTCDGYMMIQPDKGDTARHKWAEFYSPKHGWVPVDPVQIELGHTKFEKMKNIYVYASHIRNDPMIGEYEFSKYTYWGDAIRFEDSVTVRK